MFLFITNKTKAQIYKKQVRDIDGFNKENSKKKRGSKRGNCPITGIKSRVVPYQYRTSLVVVTYQSRFKGTKHVRLLSETCTKNVRKKDESYTNIL